MIQWIFLISPRCDKWCAFCIALFCTFQRQKHFTSCTWHVHAKCRLHSVNLRSQLIVVFWKSTSWYVIFRVFLIMLWKPRSKNDQFWHFRKKPKNQKSSSYTIQHTVLSSNLLLLTPPARLCNSLPYDIRHQFKTIQTSLFYMNTPLLQMWWTYQKLTFEMEDLHCVKWPYGRFCIYVNTNTRLASNSLTVRCLYVEL